MPRRRNGCVGQARASSDLRCKNEAVFAVIVEGELLRYCWKCCAEKAPEQAATFGTITIQKIKPKEVQP